MKREPPVIESYVVRIYRRDPQHPDQVAGLVEGVGLEKSKSFRTVAELLQLMALIQALPGQTESKDQPYKEKE